MKYAVVRRADIAGELLFPGDFVIDPDRAQILIERGYIVPLGESDNATPPGATVEPTINELRARARELGLPASGSKADLAAAIAAEEDRLTAEQASSASPSAEEPAQLDASEQSDGDGSQEEK